MPVIISMLRGVNAGRHNRIKMDALRAVYESLMLRDVRTYVQSGNVIFRVEDLEGGDFSGGGLSTRIEDAAGASPLAAFAKGGSLSTRIEDAIERRFGFRPNVILRTASELRDVIARNPFATRRDIAPSKLLVMFLARDPSPESREQLLKLKTAPEELHISGRELYIYYPNGLARPKLPWIVVEKTLKTPTTGRNWNSVLKMLEMAESLES